MAKEFKTVYELIGLMRSRGIQVGEDAAAAIRRESYYAIVNGYKGPFIDRSAMQSTSDDVYLEGTTFDQIYALFKFDRDLRCLTFEYLIRAEAIMKNTVAYAFCERFPEHDAYLERSNYAKAKDLLVSPNYRGNKRDLYRENMAVLMGILNKRVTPNKHMRPFVRHYVDAYGDVPLWVLTNDLTFGNMSHFYQLQRRGVQNRACKLVLEANGNGEGLSRRSCCGASKCSSPTETSAPTTSASTARPRRERDTKTCSPTSAKSCREEKPRLARRAPAY